MKSPKKVILKDLDGWIEVFIFDPLTKPLIHPLSKVCKEPLIYTLFSILLTLLACYFITIGAYALAAFSYFMSIITDGIDGKMARFTGKHIIIHGVLDVMTDQMRNAILLITLFFYLPFLQIYILLFILLLLSYEFSYAIRLELKSRHYSNQPTSYSLQELKSFYEKELFPKGHILSGILHIYNKLFSLTSKYRTYPFPTVVDAEFCLFVLTIATLNTALALLSLLILLPDLVMSIILTLSMAARLQKESEK